MLTKDTLRQTLAKAVSTGADFAEIFVEHNKKNGMTLVGGKIESITDSLTSGAGIRAYRGLQSVYATTCDLSLQGLLDCAQRVALAVGGLPKDPWNQVLTERIYGDIHPVRIVPASVENSVKADILHSAYEAAKGYHKHISQVKVNLADADRHILIANTEGLHTEDRQIRTRLGIAAVASKNGESQTGFNGPGRRMGLEMFDIIDPKAAAVEASRQAVTMLSAGYCPPGKMMVAIENGFGGVIFHEACGHSLEAEAISRNSSQFCGKVGTQIANPKVTAIDDGTIPGAWGSVNIDDEGNPSQRNVLIEKGILKGYLVDRLNGRRLGMASTGSARRESYLYEPTSRMTNTFIDNGPDRTEDIIPSIEQGLYCMQMGGGSVNPVTGDFNFSVSEGYLVRNGEIKEPVRGATLVGKGSEILMNIDMVGQNLLTSQGVCGARSGSVPTDVGQPLIRVSSITVGGR